MQIKLNSWPLKAKAGYMERDETGFNFDFRKSFQLVSSDTRGNKQPFAPLSNFPFPPWESGAQNISELCISDVIYVKYGWREIRIARVYYFPIWQMSASTTNGGFQPGKNKSRHASGFLVSAKRDFHFREKQSGKINTKMHNSHLMFPHLKNGRGRVYVIFWPQCNELRMSDECLQIPSWNECHGRYLTGLRAPA